jgi:hypothetical protein
MNNRFKQVLVWSLLLLVSFDFSNALVYFKQASVLSRPKALLYLAIHLPFIFWFGILLVKDLKNPDGLLISIWRKAQQSKMPKFGYFIVSIVFFGNLATMALGVPLYPFYDVGMFRWQTVFENEPKTVYKVKYYYMENNEPKLLDLRREGFLFFSEHFDITYSHVFTFSANYHNKAKKETFDYLSEKLKEKGIDTLWVGVQTVNYETGEVNFNPDLCNAIKVNKEERIHYGPIFIPSYQLVKCHEDN